MAAGQRRIFDVVERPAGLGSAGMAVDVTELETIRSELSVEMETHKRTLDQLATAVAIFDAGKRLVFNNEAFRQLWDLEPAFLHQAPTDGDILDRLRERRLLPEQSNFREWKRSLHQIYEAVDTEPRILEWPLPDGRFLRVVQNPDPAGGVTYVFEDLTQRLQLETQVQALGRVQRETIDNLDEAVAVFGPDGGCRCRTAPSRRSGRSRTRCSRAGRPSSMWRPSACPMSAMRGCGPTSAAPSPRWPTSASRARCASTATTAR